MSEQTILEMPTLEPTTEISNLMESTSEQPIPETPILATQMPNVIEDNTDQPIPEPTILEPIIQELSVHIKFLELLKQHHTEALDVSFAIFFYSIVFFKKKLY